MANKVARSILRGNSKAINDSVTGLVAERMADETSPLYTAVTGVAGGSGSPFIKQGGWPRWYDSSSVATLNTDQEFAGPFAFFDAERMAAVPIRITSPGMQIADARVNIVNYSTTRTLRVGIYNMEQDDLNNHGAATNLVGTLGTISANGNGVKKTASGRTPVPVEPGIYYLAIATTGVLEMHGATYMECVFDVDFFGTMGSGIVTAPVAGASLILPETFPAFSGFSQFVPWIHFQLEPRP